MTRHFWHHFELVEGYKTGETMDLFDRINRLTQRQAVALVDYLRQHAADLQKRRPTLDQLAFEMTSECGFPVTRASAGTARRTAGINWRPKKTFKQSLKVITRERIMAIVQAVNVLYSDLGLSPPPLMVQMVAEWNAMLAGGKNGANP